MKIRAVIDVKNGVPVRAIAGQRDEYRPLPLPNGPNGCLESESPTVSIVTDIIDRHRVRDFYLADLDAITGQVVNQEAIKQVASIADSLWFDIGIADSARLEMAAALVQSPGLSSANPVAIFGLESLPSPQFLSAAVDQFGADSVCFSLDLSGGKPITTIDEWQSLSPVDISEQVIKLGVRKLIVLDLKSVGTELGCPTASLCREIRTRFQSMGEPGAPLEIVTGGGVRNTADLTQLEESQVDQVLIATALESIASAANGSSFD